MTLSSNCSPTVSTRWPRKKSSNAHPVTAVLSTRAHSISHDGGSSLVDGKLAVPAVTITEIEVVPSIHKPLPPSECAIMLDTLKDFMQEHRKSVARKRGAGGRW